MLSWFDARDAQQFGTTLAEFMIARSPLDATEKKRQEVIDKMVLQIDVYKIDHRLNLFKKAKFANAFKWKLLDSRYDPEFVDTLTKKLLLRL